MGAWKTKLDLTSQRIGLWTVLRESERRRGYNRYWVCRCDCGTVREVETGELRSGPKRCKTLKSCGCYKPDKLSLDGRRIGKWTVVEEAARRGYQRHWLCRCDCGTMREVSQSTLTRQGTSKPRGCGCHPTPEERFWAKVDRKGENDCWIWTASKNKRGYGRFVWEGRGKGVHVIAWMLLRGNIEAGLCVLHNCPTGDNPSCVNPNHLFLGTKQDNSRDMAAKGRAGSQVHPERLPRGREHPLSRLTEDQVRIIKARCSKGESQSEVARQYGVAAVTVHHIMRGRTWKHVESAE